MKKHTILFLAANPLGTGRNALDEECAAIERELRMTSGRDGFDFRSKWAVSVDELMRHLNELQPAILHFSGHGSRGTAGSPAPAASRRDIEHSLGAGIFLQDEHGSQYLSEQALAKMIASAAPSTRVVVLNACYSAAVAEPLRHTVGCVVGTDDAIGDAAARSFAVAFYRALGNRRSIGNAVDQAIATLDAKQHQGARPVCKTRDGLSADQVVLPTLDAEGRAPAESAASRAGASSAAAPQRSRPGGNSAVPPKVDIGILTIRDDEFRAVLAAFPDKAGTHKGASREYALRHADAGNGARYRIAVVRQVVQGTGEAQDVARDMIDDLAPRLVLVVGIAGGLPSDDVRLGDVVVSTRIHDFTLEARKTGQAPSYDVIGGPVDRALQAAVANLAAREDELGNWTADLPPTPQVAWMQEGQLYGPPEWQLELRAKLEHHHGTGSTSRPPAYAAGPIASSDRLVKDPELLIPWLQTARSLLAIEMEAAGVYHAARERCPMLAIRGVSEIVGLKRADAWTKYACASAATFTRAFLRTRPVEVGSAVGGAVDSSSERHRSEQ